MNPMGPETAPFLAEPREAEVAEDLLRAEPRLRGARPHPRWRRDGDGCG